MRLTASCASLLLAIYSISPSTCDAQSGSSALPRNAKQASLAEDTRFRPEGGSYGDLKLVPSGTRVAILERVGNKCRVKLDGMHPIWLDTVLLLQTSEQLFKPKITPDEIRARAAETRRQAAVERAERDRQNLERQRGQIRPPSSLASQEEKEAYKARQVTQAIQRGEATVADLPEDYGGRPTGTSSRAIAARKAWDKAYAIEMENKLMREGRTSEAAALRQTRLQQEENEALKKIEADTKKLREDAERDRWLKDTGQSR